MKLKAMLLLSVMLVTMFFCTSSSSAAAQLPGNPASDRIAWWSVSEIHNLYSGNSCYELSFDPTQETDADRYRGIGDYALGVATPGGGLGFESPDGVSSAYFMTQLRRTDKVDSNGKQQAVKGGNLCFTVADQMYTEYENEFSFYIEYWSKDLNDAILSYYRKTAPGSYVKTSRNLTLKMEEDWNVLRVDVDDAWLQTLPDSGSHAYNQIFLTGTTRSWFNPRKEPIYIRRFAVVPKDIVDTLKNPDNVFDPINTRIPPSDSASLDGEPQLLWADNTASVTVNLKEIDYESATLNLFVYAYKTADQSITAIGSDSVAVTSSTETATLNASVTVPEGSELRYLIMDDKGRLLDNAAPSAMGAVSLHATLTNVTLSWQEVNDDYGCSYVIYKNGEKIAETKELFYRDISGAEGDVYTVKAVDHAGAETALSTQQTAGARPEPYFVMTADPANSSGLNIYTVSDPADSSYCEITSIDDVACVTTAATTNGTSSYVYLTATAEAITQYDREVTVLIDYYDDGTTDSIAMDYAAYARNSMVRKSIPFITGTDGAGWKQAVIQLPNAYFTRDLNDLKSCDFRIRRQSGNPLAVSRVEVIPTSLYE